MKRNRILLVDDDPVIRLSIRRHLEQKGFQVLEAENAQNAREKLARASADAVVIDFSISNCDGMELLAHFKTSDPDIPVIVLTGQASIELAVHAMKEGAEQFLTKPVELPVLSSLLVRAIENKRIRNQSIVNQSKAQRDRLNPFLGTSSVIRHLEELATRVVRSESPILIQGETGSGKGVLAKWIHENSPRGDEIFMDLNCAGLEREFLETELFGHERGAFTGAVHSKPGLLEVADRGTVFFDEIGDIDPAVQPKLLKVLEAHQFRRLGDVRDRTVDIRLISATHRDLKELVRKQLFREDLFFRITIIPIRIPPLRERQEDIPVLAKDILERIAAERGSGATHLDPAAMATLVQYPWPGNIREMHNVLERAAQIAHHTVLTVKDLELQYPVGTPTNGNGKRKMLTENSLTLRELESLYIEAILQEESGSIDRAARRLGISRSSLYSKVKNKEVDRRAAQW